MRFTVLAIGVFVALAMANACSDDDNVGTGGGAGTTVQAPGAAGSTAGTTGAAGTGAAGTGVAGTGAGGAAQTFMALAPCNSPTDYVATATVTVSPTVIGYAPACVKTTAGSTITIGASTFHPLSGTTNGSPNNPIPLHQTTPQTVSFPTPGFYTFQCDVHFSLGMIGVIWVTP